MKRALLALILALPLALSAQFRIVGTGLFTTLNDSTYRAKIDFRPDLTGNSYNATQLNDSMLVLSQKGQLYRLDSFYNASFSSAFIIVVEKNGNWGSPVGQVMVFQNNSSLAAPQAVYGANGATAGMQAGVDTWNALLLKVVSDSAVYWNQAYSNSIDSLNVSGDSLKTITLYRAGGDSISATFVDGGGNGPVTDTLIGEVKGPLDSTYIDTVANIIFTTTTDTTVGVGELEYNDTQGSLIQGLKGGNVTNVIGQQIHQRVLNATGAPLTKGTAVFLHGSQGNRITVRKALATVDSTSANTFGIVAESIADNQSGYVITEGLITNMNTNALTEGAAVYLSPTVAGELTTTKPQAPQHTVYIGVCVKQNAGSGELFVKIRNGQELDELHDVRIDSLASNASLYYNAAQGVWRDTGAAVLVADTSAMLTNYINVVDTAAMLTNYINIADTATMLSSYISNADTSVFARDFQISGTAGQVAYFNAANAVTSDTAFRWSAANKTLGINTSTTSGANIIIKNSQEPVRTTFIANQTFSADTTNWTRGAGWTFNGTAAVATAATGNLTYTTMPTATIGNGYEVTFSITSYTSGLLQVGLGGGSLAVVNLPTHTVTGNVVLISPSALGANLQFIANTFTGHIDNVSVVEISKPASVVLAGQDDNSSTIYGEIRYPNSSSVFIGDGGRFNTAIGTVGFGEGAGYSHTAGISNVYFGYQAGYRNTTGGYSNYFGYNCGFRNTIGSYNNFFGFGAGGSNTIGSFNNFFGREAGSANTTGGTNNYFGDQAGVFATGSGNNAFGRQTLRSSSGSNNNAFGLQAGYSNTTGISNNYIGELAGTSNTTGNYNNFIGTNAGRNSISGSNNIAISVNAAQWLRTGGSNIFIGASTGPQVTADSLSGSNNIVMGTSAADNIRAAAAGNVAIGNQVDLPTSNGSNQGVYQNVLFFTGASGTGTTIAAGSRAGIKTNAPASDFHVAGEVRIDDLKPTGAPRNIVGSSSTGDLSTMAWGNGLTVSVGDTILRVDTSVILPKVNVSGTAGQVTYFSAANSVTSDTAFRWSAANKTLGINTSTTSGANIIIKNSQEPSRSTVVATQTFDADTTNWTRGTGWTFNGTAAVATAATGALTYTPALTITSGNAYEVTYTISGYSAGTLTAAVGNATYALPTYNATANVVVLLPTSATGGFRFTTSTFTGNIDDITVSVVENSAPIIIAGQDNNTSTIYNPIRMPNQTALSIGGGGAYTTGNNNNFFGSNAGRLNTTGSFNSFFGSGAGEFNTTGNSNNFFGQAAGSANTTGNNNNFFGSQAGQNNTTGAYNNYFGNSAGRSATTASNNNIFGLNAGGSLTTGSGNNIFGGTAGRSTTTGIDNVFIGGNSGFTNTTGQNNIFISTSAGYLNTTGGYNIAIGTVAGYTLRQGSDNIFIGRTAGTSTVTADTLTGSSNIAIGRNAADNIRAAAVGNVAIGNQVDLPTNNGSNQGVYQNVLFFTGASGTGTTIAAGSRAGIKTNAPASDFHVAGEVRIDDLKPTGTPRNIVGSSSTGDLSTMAWGNGLTMSVGDTILRADTSVLASKTWVNNEINADTISLSNRINTKLNISDTSVFARDFQISGTANYLAKFTGSNAVGNSVAFETGRNLYINSAQGNTSNALNNSFEFNGYGSAALDQPFLAVIGNVGVADYRPRLAMYRTKGTTVNDRTLVPFNHHLGSIQWNAADGVDMLSTGAEITAITDSITGENDMPTALTFATTANGAASTTERMRITSTGNVGIANNAPTNLLDVGNTSTGPTATIGIKTNTSAATTKVSFENGTSVKGDVLTTSNATVIGTGGMAIQTTTNHPIIFRTNSSGVESGGNERMRILEGGNVGIATSSPSRPLHVDATSAIRIPVGNFAQRGTSGAGDIRVRNDTANLEFHNGTSWQTVATQSYVTDNAISTVYIPINLYAPGDTVANTTNSKAFFLVHSGLNGYCIDSYTVKAFSGSGTADIQIDKNGTGGNLQAISGTTVATKDTNIALATGDYIRGQVFNLSGTLVGLGLTLEIKKTCN